MNQFESYLNTLIVKKIWRPKIPKEIKKGGPFIIHRVTCKDGVLTMYYVVEKDGDYVEDSVNINNNWIYFYESAGFLGAVERKDKSLTVNDHIQNLVRLKNSNERT